MTVTLAFVTILRSQIVKTFVVVLTVVCYGEGIFQCEFTVSPNVLTFLLLHKLCTKNYNCTALLNCP